jgi:hypothetical protein
VLAAVAMLPLGGCAWHKKQRVPRAQAVADETPPANPHRIGTVAVVNDDLHFVLLDVGSLYSPPAGMALKTFSGGAETGVLAVDAEKRRPFVVADIVKGEPKVGDEVKE